MRRAVSTLLLASFAAIAPAHADDAPPRHGPVPARVANLYVQHAGSEQLLIQVRIAGAAARADRAEVEVTRPDGTHAVLIARVPAALPPLAAGDEVEVESEPAVGMRAAAEFKVARLLTPRTGSVASPATAVVAAEGGRLFIRAGARAPGDPAIARGEAATHLARLLREGPPSLKLARAGDAAD